MKTFGEFTESHIANKVGLKDKDLGHAGDFTTMPLGYYVVKEDGRTTHGPFEFHGEAHPVAKKHGRKVLHHKSSGTWFHTDEEGNDTSYAS